MAGTLIATADPSKPHTRFSLTRGDERRHVITPPACPMFHDLPTAVADLVAQGFRITGHVDNFKGEQ